MKKLMLIALSVLAFSTKAQSPMFKIGKKTITDYDLHFAIAGNMAVHSSTSFYYFTDRPVLSILVGIVASSFNSIVIKEVVHDKVLKLGTFSGIDIEGDVKGIFTYEFINFGVTDMVHKKRIQFDTLRYQNLAPIKP